MIIRAMALGFLLWLAATAAFRFLGHTFFVPSDAILTLLYPATVVGMIVLTWLCLKLLRVEPGDEAEGAIGLAVPGMFLDAYLTNEFTTLLPNLDPELAPTFGSLMLTGYGAVIFAGLLFTRIAPKDERL